MKLCRLVAWVLVLVVSACDDHVAGDRDAPLDAAVDADSHRADSTRDAPQPHDLADADSPELAQDDAPVDAGPDSDVAAGACEAVDPAAFGDCLTVLGVGFDGTTCVGVSGCDCGALCDRLFETRAGCASSCAQAGRCDDRVLVGEALNLGQPVRSGTSCDGIGMCADAAEQTALREAFANVRCEPAPDPACGHGDRCFVVGNLVLSEVQATLLCRLSLAGDDPITCPLYGP